MKKFISISVVLVMLLTMVPVVSFASGEISIISPAADVYTDFSVFEVECENAEKIIFKLDGVTVGETNGETTLDVPKDLLYVGNHTLEVIAIYADGTALNDIKNFKVSAIIEKFSYSDAGALSNFIAYNTTGKAEYDDTVGVSGQTGDIAKKLYAIIDGKIESKAPYIINYELAYVKGGIKKISFDLKLTTVNDAIIIRGMDGMDKSGQLNSSKGYWLDGSTQYYPTPGEWMHIDVVSNNYTNNLVFSVDGTPIYNGSITLKDEGNLTFRMYQYGDRTEATRASMSIDNLFTSQEFEYSLSSVEWEDSEGVWSDGLSLMPIDASKIRIKMSEALIADSVTKDTVSIYDNGKKVSLSDVVYDETNGYVIASLSEPLSNESNIEFVMSENVKLSVTNEATGVPVKAILKTELGAYSVSNIECKVNSAALWTNEQLKSGDVISIDLALNNQSGENKTMAAIACVFQNKKLRAIGACEEFVSSAGKGTTITLPPLSNLDSDGEITIKVMLCNALSSPQACSNYYEIK